MRTKLFIFIALISIMLLGSAFTSNRNSSSNNIVMQDDDYAGLWKEVEALSNKGLPRSALDLVEKILEKAAFENNYAQYLKATLYKLKLQSDFEEDYLPKAIREVQDEAGKAGEPVKQILHSVLAELYYGYYQVNRYRFLERSVTTGMEQDDIETWDLKKIMEEITGNYLASLDNADLLQKVKLESFDPILETREGSKRFRPTLYDFLANRAADFFMNDESALTRPGETFEIDDPAYLSPASQFSGIQLHTSDPSALKFYALEILQDLIRFHLNDKNPQALVDADLKRLNFVKDNAIFAYSDSLYVGALEKLRSQYTRDTVYAEVSYFLAKQYLSTGSQYQPYGETGNQWDLKKSLDYCVQALQAFPGSYGARNCQVIKEQILNKSLSITSGYAVPGGEPFLALLSFRNTGKAYFRIITMDYREDKEIQANYRREALIEKYRNFDPLIEFSVDTRDPGDYQNHKAEVAFPALPVGYYVVLASTEAGFNAGSSIVAWQSFWASDISYLSQKPESGATDFHVLNRTSGHPMENVEVKSWFEEYDYQSRKYNWTEGPSYRSDAQGYFSIPASGSQSRRFMLEFIKDKDKIVTPNYFYQNPTYRKQEKTILKTFFFTDRAIYRPGQTVYFKGIILEYDGKEYRIKSGEPTTVSFLDANNQKVSEQTFTTGDYGSFHGSFIAPMGVMNGNMQIKDAYGSVGFSVEEYKRPAFEVTFEPLQGTYKLNETIHLTGEAMAYAGFNLDNARVSYRVTHQANFPYWRWWYGYFPQSQVTEIVNGETSTDKNGQFHIDFKAIPDYSVNTRYKPVFTYNITASVTDINGETHENTTTVSVGATAMIVEMTVPEQIMKEDPGKILYTTRNLNRQKVEAGGTIKVQLLKSPEKPLRQREWDRPDIFLMSRDEFSKKYPKDIYDNENDPSTWETEEEIMSLSFSSGRDSILDLSPAKQWKTGKYRIVLTAKDAFGEEIREERFFTLYSTTATGLPLPALNWFAMHQESGEPGESISLYIGSSEKSVKVIFEVLRGGEVSRKEFITLSNGQKNISIPILEEDRGNFAINLTYVLWNRSFQEQRVIRVPYTNKELEMEFATFRNKLLPGQQEEWQIRIRDSKGEKVAAEMLAAMYDASLDAFRVNQWSFSLYAQRYFFPGWNERDAFTTRNSQTYSPPGGIGAAPAIREYDQLNWFGFRFYSYPSPMMLKQGLRSTAMNVEDDLAAGAALEVFDGEGGEKGEPETTGMESAPPSAPEPEPPLQIRRDFRETAFFFPDLKTNEEGDVILSFTVPESLTRWKMMGMAYTQDLKTGRMEKEAVTQKDLMVIPNPPRFFRQGDRMDFSAKVVNLSDKTLEGMAKLEFFDAITMKPLQIFAGDAETRTFSVSKGNSQALSWEISIPGNLSMLTYRIVATARNFSDGEEKAIPVLTNRMLVTETMPMPVNGKETKAFTFEKLVKQESKTSGNYGLTLEFTSNPAWYAIQALPYLTEYPYECSEQIFSRYYANSIASHIANSDPKIRRVFDSWKSLTPDALQSNLEKNQELKTAVLEATPWVLQAKNETERKQRIGLLFDLSHMASGLRSALGKLQQAQLPNGGWPWFEGMKDNRYITQHMVTGFGHLDHLGVTEIRNDAATWNMLTKAVFYLDDRMREDYEDISKNFEKFREEQHIGRLQIQYLYARSYFLEDIKLSKRNEEAFAYFREQAKTYWLKQDKYMQGMIALAMNRLGVKSLPSEIIASLKEHALYDDEMGMYWRKEGGYYWYEAPVETQALMIEAFDEVAHDMISVEKMKIWLLKQKQTQDWETTKATTEACYALLLRGSDLLASDELVEIKVGDKVFDPGKMDGVQVEAGTGYFQTSWMGGDISPEMGHVTVTKKDEGIAWGAMYWQYFEDLDRITPAKTPLSINKKLFVEENTKSGPVIRALEDGETIKVGDRIKVRIEISSDRDMEFIHLKDMRAAGFEPVNVLSGYRYQDGLGYYESTLDASTDFFIGFLPRGTYVFEYPLVASQAGDFSNGITTIQCMYAPEFSSHSEGIRVKIQ